ncbi:MAG: hypothetical protein HKN91_04660 [Acidimicrobiia bacterium]|nr:hypothetical protein [Acidimicrobiia bacterium]
MRSQVDPSNAGERQLSMLSSGLSLFSGKGLAMLLGFGYWVAAANLYEEHIVGLVGAAISGILLVGQLSVLGLESSIVLTYREYAERRTALFNTAFSLVALASFVASIGLLLVMVAMQGDLAQIATNPGLALLFVLMGTFAGVMTVQDQMSMALRRGDQVIPRNVTNGIASIVPLLIIAAMGAVRGGAAVLFGSWIFGSFSGIALGVLQMRRLASPYHFRPGIDREIGPAIVRTGIPNHVLTLTERIPVFVTPLIITEVLSPTANAHWYVVWMAAWVTLVAARSLASALLAEASNNPDQLSSHTWRALRGMLVIGALGATATVLLAPHVLAILGNSYSAEGTAPLRLLVLSFAPYSVLMAYFGVCRVSRRLQEANILGVFMACALIGATATAASRGLIWVAGSWVAVTAFFGLIAGARLYRILQVIPEEAQV